MRYLYKYDPNTFEYIGSVIRQSDPVASKESRKPVYFNVPCTTDIAPPSAVFQNKTIVFDIENNKWTYISDYRGIRVINVETKELGSYNKLGEIEYPFTTNIPDKNHVKYLSYVDNNWVVTERDNLVNDIWELRKRIRDRKCEEDIEYNGHMFHVDKTSYNDLLLAAQEVLLTNNVQMTKTWITADSDSVTLTGTDLISILRQYGNRRQTLVYESNNQWKKDLELTDAELLDLYDELRILAYIGE